MKRRTLLQASPLLFGLPELAQAQAAYPSKPIRYIVPVSAGGGSDMVGRALCERWAKVLGQSVVVDNIGGGGGVIASQSTARAPADGYTLMQGYVATHGTAPATRKLPLIGGQTQLMFPGLAAALPHIRSGRIRALAVTGTKRHPQVKDIPTLEEMGLKGFDAQQWYGVVGPANMPAAIVKTLNDFKSGIDFSHHTRHNVVHVQNLNIAEFLTNCHNGFAFVVGYGALKRMAFALRDVLL